MSFHWQRNLAQFLVSVATVASQMISMASSSSDSLALLPPPPFPDILFAFQQSLSTSDLFRDFVIGVVNNASLPCVCRHSLVETNSAEYVSFPNNKNHLCSGDKANVFPNTESSINRAGGDPETAGMAQQGRALIIGISSGLVVALCAGILIVVLRKRLCAQPAAQLFRTVTRSARAIITVQRQCSDCQQMMNTSDYAAAPHYNPQNSSRASTSDTAPTVIVCCQYSGSVFLSCCNFSVSSLSSTPGWTGGNSSSLSATGSSSSECQCTKPKHETEENRLNRFHESTTYGGCIVCVPNQTLGSGGNDKCLKLPRYPYQLSGEGHEATKWGDWKQVLPASKFCQSSSNDEDVISEQNLDLFSTSQF